MRVNRLRFDDATSRWHVGTDRGDEVTARFVIAATGSLNATNIPDFKGTESFAGQWYHTSKWPKEGVDFAGKRVGIIGTGSTGIQVIPVVAKEAAHLTVFQRTHAALHRGRAARPRGLRLRVRDSGSYECAGLRPRRDTVDATSMPCRRSRFSPRIFFFAWSVSCG